MTSATNKIISKYPSPKIVLVGWYGAGNLGDELLLSTMIREVHSRGMEPIIVSLDPTYTTNYHCVQSIDFEDLDALQLAIDGAYACVLGGGGLFQTYSPFEYSSLFEFSLGDVASYARPVLLAQQLGVPTALLAQGVGPLDTSAAQGIVALLFSGASCVSVRDVASRDLLNAIGVERDITVAPDPSWAWEMPELPQPSRAQSHMKIVLVVRDWSFVSGWEDRLLSALRQTFDPAVHELVWVPFQARNVPERSSSDTDLLHRLMTGLGDYWNQRLFEWTNIPQAVEMIASADAVIAMRMHAQILALKLNKPTLCLEYDEKMTQVSIQAEVPLQRRLRLTSDQDIWLQAVRSLLVDSSANHVQKENIQRLASSAGAHFALLWETLGMSTGERPPSLTQNGQHLDWLSFWRTWEKTKNITRYPASRIREIDFFIGKSSEENKNVEQPKFYNASIAFQIGMRARESNYLELHRAFEQKAQEAEEERNRNQLLEADRARSIELLQTQIARSELLEDQLQQIQSAKLWQLLHWLKIL
jgi:polysaccharide pyruvyl transferase CsaB